MADGSCIGRLRALCKRVLPGSLDRDIAFYQTRAFEVLLDLGVEVR